MRIEHNQSLINNFAYGRDDNGSLPVADYKVTAKAGNNRGVYSFACVREDMLLMLLRKRYDMCKWHELLKT